MSWENILKRARVTLKRAIGIPVMQEIFNSGNHPEIIDTASGDFDRLQEDFLNKYGEKEKNFANQSKRILAFNPDKYKSPIIAYGWQVGFHFIYTAPDGQVHDPAGRQSYLKKGKGERHFYMDGDTPIEWTGPTHKHPDGTLMSGKEHIEGKSKKLLHLNELSKDALKKVGKTSYSKSRSAFTDRD